MHSSKQSKLGKARTVLFRRKWWEAAGLFLPSSKEVHCRVHRASEGRDRTLLVKGLLLLTQGALAVCVLFSVLKRHVTKGL